jgi:hypothetical protein
MSTMTDERAAEPGTVGITIEVIEYDGATHTYSTVKSVKFAPSDGATARAQGMLAFVRGRGRRSLNLGGER